MTDGGGSMMCVSDNSKLHHSLDTNCGLRLYTYHKTTHTFNELKKKSRDDNNTVFLFRSLEAKRLEIRGKETCDAEDQKGMPLIPLNYNTLSRYSLG